MTVMESRRSGVRPRLYTLHCKVYSFGLTPTVRRAPAVRASFTATFTDGNNHTLTVNVRLMAGHSGYAFEHLGNWIDKPAHGQGGLLLEGGGDDATMLQNPTNPNSPTAISWFVNQANGGDIVIIANNLTASGAAPR